MKRFMIYCLVLAFIAAIPLSHSLMADKAEKVSICHVNSANPEVEYQGKPVIWGIVIEVSENAVAAHLNHGDSTTYTACDEACREFNEEYYGVTLPNASCYIYSP